MSDIKITSVQPTPAQDRVGKTQQKPNGTPAFDAKLEQAIAQLEQVKSQAEATSSTKAGEVGDLQKNLKTTNDLYQEMLKAQQNLSQLYRNMQRQDKS